MPRLGQQSNTIWLIVGRRGSFNPFSIPVFDGQLTGVLSEIVERVLLNLVEVGRIIVLDKFVTAALMLENGDSSHILLDIPKMRILQT